MVKVETQEQADHLNEEGTYGPYRAANGHHMLAALRYPLEWAGDRRLEREYRIGDEIRYDSWSAWCADDCDHSGLGPLPDY